MSYLNIILLICTCLWCGGCKKYLDAKPSQGLVVPTTLADLQALLDYYPKMNNFDVGAGEFSADDYYLTGEDWNTLSEYDRRLYTWEKDYVFNPGYNDWRVSYETVYYANTVLEAVENIQEVPLNKTERDNVKGQALFFRGKKYLEMAFIWAKAYDSQTAAQDLGMPLRLHTDFNVPSTRASVQQTYEQVLNDLKGAAALLPVTPKHKMRPSKPAAFALLARAYLSMRQYDQAGAYADSCLQLYQTLTDYNTVNANASFPFAAFGPEVIFDSRIGIPPPIIGGKARIDSTLYNSYHANDLRKMVFFKSMGSGVYAFKGTYNGQTLFSGVASDEVYLMRAECFARQGKVAEAMGDLNNLLKNRWKKGLFTPLEAADGAAALSLILTERRKELLTRGLRWMDIKRLNKEGAGISLQRVINNTVYQLPANDLRFALPLPEDILELTGMEQNPR